MTRINSAIKLFEKDFIASFKSNFPFVQYKIFKISENSKITIKLFHTEDHLRESGVYKRYKDTDELLSRLGCTVLSYVSIYPELVNLKLYFKYCKNAYLHAYKIYLNN